MHCAGVMSGADLWDDIQRTMVPSFLVFLSVLMQRCFEAMCVIDRQYLVNSL